MISKTHVYDVSATSDEYSISYPVLGAMDTATSFGDVRRGLEDLKKHEAVVTERLDNLLLKQRELSRELERLDLSRASVSTQANATRAIGHGMLASAASNARRVSGAVRRLDLEQSRVKATLEVVDQVAELKACVLGVTGSMGAPQDWETAASYLNRASKIPDTIINGSFAQRNVPTADVPDPPHITLANASSSLQVLFLREFETAAKDGDGARVTRFFKLFPLIGRPEVGLDVYGRYICKGVATRARAALNAGTGAAQRKEGYFYANALTQLFEHIAQIIENHGTLIERHYGEGRLVRVVERLQAEADVQGGIILDTWSDDRKIDRRLTDIRSYAFTFLVQSFLPAPPDRSGTPRGDSPARRGTPVHAQAAEEDSIDTKELGGLLGEMAMMLSRWSLYSKFVATKCRSGEQAENRILEQSSLLQTSSLYSKIHSRLVAPFNTITTFLFRRSVERAFQLDEQPPDLSFNLSKQISSNPPFITSAVDDVMYIVSQVMERTLSTSQKSIVANVIPTMGRILGSDFIGMIQRKMRDENYPKSVIQGALPPKHTILAFFVLLNNLDVATEYIKRIVQSRLDLPTSSQLVNGADSTPKSNMVAAFPFDQDAVFVEKTLRSLQSGFEMKATELSNDGFYVVLKNVVRPQLRPLLADTFRDIDYQMSTEELDASRRDIDEEEEDRHRSQDNVAEIFQSGWDALTRPIARILTAQNNRKLLTSVVNHLSEILERRIWSYHGRLNELGAVRLERDITSIVNVALKGGSYEVRSIFARCTQICMILNLETEEWDELKEHFAMKNPNEKDSENLDEDDSIDWKLSTKERVRARSMIKG